MDTLERYFSHSVTRSRIVPLSLLLWTSFKSSEFIKFSAINYHSVYIQIFALSLSRIVAGFCSRNVLSQQHDLGSTRPLFLSKDLIPCERSPKGHDDLENPTSSFVAPIHEPSTNLPFSLRRYILLSFLFLFFLFV